jgi:chromosome segregation ATPase
MVGPRLATFDELDSVKKELQTLERRVDNIVTGLNAALRHAQQADQRQRRTERLDVARLERLQELNPELLMVTREFPGLSTKVDRLERALAALQRGSGRH